ncbi:hypothetical protein DWB77_00502 [Streptomyces hundungensis]|uniref:Uncharacterized protein n=1 Tax=Streptomyces hundungensis TaxID=1077946 RepID=A0A387H3W9_9ACTN|nr:hypothetical protein [Streptomyces hundungensis]AYG78395.1 hypothetical protein DWB77_00502 [Streptomyces hundungensis]
MSIELNPPDRVGPVAVGMSMGEAEEALRSLPGFVRLGTEGGTLETRGFATYSDGMAIAAHLGTGGKVEAIEVFRPLGGTPVMLDGVDVFAGLADEVIARFAARGELVTEDRGRTIILPGRMVVFGREDIPRPENPEAGLHFDSVLVARPGYYDAP